MKKVKLGKYISEYSVRNKGGDRLPVYSVTNSNGFCKEYFNKDVSSEDKTNYKVVPFGYFAYNPSRINVGSIDCQEAEDKVIVSPLYNVFKCNDSVNRIFLKYFFKSTYGTQLIKANTSGSVRANLKFKTLCDFEIIERTLAEQEKAINIFTMLNELISKEKRCLLLMDELIKSQFIELFGDPMFNNKGFKTKRIDAISKNLDSKRVPITEKDRKFGIFPYYGASGIVDYVDDYIFDEDLLLVSEDGANLLMRSTPIAFSVNGKIWVNNHAHVLKFENIAMQKYVEYFFAFINVSPFVTGAAQPKLNQAKLNSILIPVPDKKDLDTFYVFLNQVDKSKLNIQKRIEYYQELLNKKMDECFN